MKKLLILAFVLITGANLFATNANLFDLNEEELTAEFSELNTLESAVLANSAITLQDAVAMNLVDETFNAETTATSSSQFQFQWEGFLWGFLCCPIGLFTVAVNKNKTKDNKTSYWIGVAANTVISTIYYVAVASTTSTTTTTTAY